MDNTKQNDWFVASLLSPDKTFQDFKSEGVTPDNTTIQDKSVYRNNDKVQDRFKDSNGNFDEVAFNSFYNSTVSTYNKFASDSFDDSIKSAPEYFKYTSLKPKHGKVIEPFKVEKVSNPFESTINMQGLNVVGETKLSVAELAQKNMVKDSSTGKDLGWTPNEDGGLFSIFSKPTVAIAQYDEDGYDKDPETGKIKKHRKGDFKLNEEGKFFYETICKRDPAGKQILSIWDSNTVDGSFANKFDFMDSDDKEKSITGSVVKTIARVAPLFIPGVGEYYAGATIGEELLEVLPMLAQSGASLLFGEDQKNKDYYKALTATRSFKRSLDTGVSEYSKQHAFSSENILQMVGDVFGQLKQQKLIASIPQKIGWTKAESAAYRKGVELYGDEFVELMANKGYKNASLSGKLQMMQESIPELGKMIRGYDQLSTVWARGLSNMYMASTSAAGVVDDARNNGLSEKETAALFLGTMGGYSAMMAKLEIGHWATKGLGLDETGLLIKKAVKENAAQIQTTLKSIAAEPSETKRLNKLFSIGKNIGKFVSKKVSNIEDYYGAALGEGIEEVTEESMADSIKTIYNGLSALGVTPTKDKQFKFSGEEMVQRYAMSLLGGALGGTIFKASERLSQNTFDNKNEELKKDLIHLIRNGHSDEILKTIEKYEKQGLLGNKNLSMDIDESSDVSTGLINYKASINDNDNQNSYIGNVLKAEINTVKNIIFQENVPTDRIIDDIYNNRLQGIFDFKVNTSIRDDVNQITSDIITKRNEIAQLKVDNDKKEDVALTAKINEKEKELAALSFELKKIGSGEYYEKYLAEGLFNINTALNGPFSVKDKNKIALQLYNKPLNELTTEESTIVDKEYESYINSDRKGDLKNAKEKFDIFFKSITNAAETLNEYGDLRHGYYNQTLSYQGTISELTRPETELPSVDKNIIELGVFNPSALGENDVETLTNIINSSPYIDIEIKRRVKHLIDNITFRDDDLVHITNSIDKALQNIDQEGNPTDFFRDVYSQYGLPELLKLNDYKNVTIANIDEFSKNMSEYYSSDEFKQELESITDGEFTADEFQTALFDFVDVVKTNNAELYGKLQNLKKSTEGKKASPLQELIRKINISNDDIDSKTVFDLLDQEVKNMNDKSDLSQYIIENQVTEKQIDIAVDMLNQIESAINGATNFTYKEGVPIGYVSAINKFKEDSGDIALNTISTRANTALVADVNIIRTKLLFFRKLSQINQESKVKNQKSSGLMAQGLFFKMFSEDEDIRFKLEEIGVDISELDSIIDSSVAMKNVLAVVNDEEGKIQLDLTSDFISQVELEMTTLENHLYNSFQQVKANDNKAPSKINELFDPVVLAEQDSTEFTSLTRKLKEYDKFVYLNTILNSDSLKFRKELYGNEGDILASSKFAPFFSQEYYSRIFYWMLEDRNSYNNAIHYFKRKKVDSDQDPQYENYKDELYSQLYHTLLIYGRPGVGKTTGTISIIGKLLSNRGLNSAVYGPSEKQGVNLHDSLSDVNVANDSTGKSKEDLLKLFISESTYKKLKEDREKLKITTTAKVEEDSLIQLETSTSKSFMRPILNKNHELLKDLFSGNNNSQDILVNGKPIGAIIIDEITHFTTDEIEIIHQGVVNYNKSHRSNPISLILSGDPNQSGAMTDGYTTNINFFKGIQGPYLSISMRSGYNLKSNNLDASFSILNALENLQRKNNNRTTEAQVSEFINDANNIINLKYSQEDIFVGDKLAGEISKSDIDQMLKNTKDKIGVIYSDENSQLLKTVMAYPDYKDKFDIKTPDLVQGLEYDYVLIDVNNPNAKENIINARVVAKSLNTLISRSKIGSIITNSTVNGLEVTSDNKNVIVVKTELPRTQIEEFKDLRISSLKNTIENVQSEITNKTSSGIVEEPEEKTSTNTIVTDDSGENIIENVNKEEPEEEVLEPTYNEPSDDVLVELRNNLLGLKENTSIALENVKNNDLKYDDSKSFMFSMYDRFGVNMDVMFGKPISAVDSDYDFQFLYNEIYKKELNAGDLIPKNEYKYITQELKKLKGALYSYSAKIAENKDYDLATHLRAYNVDRRIFNDLNLDSVKVGIRIKYFNPLVDKTFSLSEDNPKQTSGGLGRFIVVEFEDSIGNPKFITIGSLPSPYINNKEQSGLANNVPSNIRDNLISLDNIFKEENKTSDPNFEIIRYFKDGFESIIPFSNIKIRQNINDAGLKETVSLTNFINENKNLTISNPYIFSGSKFTIENNSVISRDEEDLLTDNIYNQKIIGKPVVLVSNDKTLRPSDLRGYLENQIKESIEEKNHRLKENKKREEAAINGESYIQKPFKRHYPDVVKMIPLEVAGIKFSDWYNRQLELINAPKSSPDKVLKLKTNGDKFVGTRMYNSMYNFIQDIDYIKRNSNISYDNDIFKINPNDKSKTALEYYSKMFEGFTFPVRGQYKTGVEAIIGFQEALNECIQIANKIMSNNGVPLKVDESSVVGKNLKERRLKAVFNAMPDSFDIGDLPQYSNAKYNHTYTLFTALKTVFSGGKFGTVTYKEYIHKAALKDVFNGLDLIMQQDFPLGIFHNTITLAAKKRKLTDDVPFIIETENPTDHYGINVKIGEPTLLVDLSNLEVSDSATQEIANDNSAETFNRTTESILDDMRKELSEIMISGGFDELLSRLEVVQDALFSTVNKDNLNELSNKFISSSGNIINNYLKKNPFVIHDGNAYNVKLIGLDSIYVDKFEITDITSDIKSELNKAKIQFNNISYSISNDALNATVHNAENKKIATFEYKNGILNTNIEETADQIHDRILNSGNSLSEMIINSEFKDKEALSLMISRIMNGDLNFDESSKKSFTDMMSRYYNELNESARSKVKELTEEFTNRISCL